MFWYKAEYSIPDVGSVSPGASIPDKVNCAKCVYKARVDNWRPIVLYIGNFPNGQCTFPDDAYPIQHSTTSTKEFAIVYGKNFLYNTFHFFEPWTNFRSSSVSPLPPRKVHYAILYEYFIVILLDFCSSLVGNSYFQ